MNTLAKNVIYEFTNDNALLEQYFAIRDYCYRVELGVLNYSGARTENDLDGHILVAIRDGKCIGGIRWIPSPMNNRRLLQVEHSGIRVADILPELQLQNYNYCEFGRLAIMKDERQNGKVARDLFGLLIERIKECGMDFFIMEIDKTRDAHFRRIFSELGVGFCKQDVDPSFLTYAKPYELALYVTKL